MWNHCPHPCTIKIGPGNAILELCKFVKVSTKTQVTRVNEKMCLKVFVVVIRKEGLADLGPANPSLGMTLTTEYNL